MASVPPFSRDPLDLFQGRPDPLDLIAAPPQAPLPTVNPPVASTGAPVVGAAPLVDPLDVFAGNPEPPILQESKLDQTLSDMNFLERAKKNVTSTALAFAGRAIDVVDAVISAPGIVSATDQQLQEMAAAGPAGTRRKLLSQSFRELARATNPVGHLDKLMGGMGLVKVPALDNLLNNMADTNAEGAAELLGRLDKLEKENIIPGFWTEQLPGAVGTTATIAAASYATRGQAPAWMVAGYLGSALGMEEGIRDALNHGATPAQSRLAAGVGALLGTTEALPVTRLLDRLDTATGGTISTAVEGVVKKKLVGNALVEGLKGAFEEALQEVAQTLGMDALAAMTYDPERGVTDRWVDAAAAGGGTGFVLSALTTALGIPLRNRQQRELRAKQRRADVERVTGLPSSDPSNAPFEEAIQRDAPFTLLTPEYQAFMSQYGVTLVEEIEKLGALATANPQMGSQEVIDTLNAGRTSGVRATLGPNLEMLHAPSDVRRAMTGISVNPTIEKDLFQSSTRSVNVFHKDWYYNPGMEGEYLWMLENPNIGGDTAYVINEGKKFKAVREVGDNNPEDIGIFETAEEARVAIQKVFKIHQTQQMPGLDVFSALKKQPVVVGGFTRLNDLWNREKEVLERFKQERAALPPNDPRIANQDHLIKGMEAKVKESERNARYETLVATEAKNLIAGLRLKYLHPDTKIAITPVSGFDDGKYGAMWGSSDGRTFQIFLNPVALAGRAVEGGSALVKARETILHEFGHALAYQRLQELKARVTAATVNEPGAMKAMMESQGAGDQSFWMRVRELQEEGKARGRPVATQADFVTFQGIMREYIAWAGKTMNNPFLQRFLTISPPDGIMRAEMGSERATTGKQTSAPHYWYNFDEFMAENFARVASTRAFATEGVGKFFEDHQRILKTMYDEYSNVSNMPVFETWIKRMSLEGRLSEIISRQSKEVHDWYSLIKNPSKAKELGLDPEAFKGFEESLDHYSKWHAYGLTILQVARNNGHIRPLQDYVRFMQRMEQEVTKHRWRAHNTIRQWRQLGRKQSTLLGEILFEETLSGQALSPEQLAERGLHPDAIEAKAQISADFGSILREMENVLTAEVRQNFANDPVALQHELKKLGSELANMKSKPFFPLMRFGRHTVQVRDAEGKLVEFQTFESRPEREKALKDIRKSYDETHTIGQGYLSDASISIQGMQAPMIRALRKKLSDHSVLTPEMDKAIKEMLQDALPMQSFRNHFARRRKTKGFNQDAMRGYAAYMVQAATHLGRLKYIADLNTFINQIDKDSRVIASMGGDGTKRGQIAEMSRDHLNYILNPGNDWPMLRAVGFNWLLGFNLKSAVVNATQIFTGTQPYLASRYGDAEASRAIVKAGQVLTRQFAGRPLPDGVAEMLATGKSQGWLEQSLATELAVARSQRNPAVSSVWTKFSEASAWMFSTVEKMNRQTTATATYMLAKKDGWSHLQATALARDAVQFTQAEYSHWGRARFMRGKVGANVFLFKGFMQNQLFMALGKDPANARVMFAMVLMGGLMGLPFAEDLLDLFDVGSTKLRRMLGWENPKVQAKLFIRDLLLQMQMNPDLFLYGLSENSMGLGYLGDLTGWPIPQVNLQGSLSMGNVVPGTTALRRLQEADASGAFLDFLGELGGAEASYMADVANALLTDNPDSWKRWEQSLPAALRGLAKSGRYAIREGEFDARGQPIAEFDPTDAQDQMEVAAQLLGFTPSSVSKGWERMLAQREAIVYYEVWKRSLLANFNQAKLYDSSEEAAEALQAIKDYNQDVPFPELRIGADTINRSLQEFARSRAEAGKSIPPSRNSVRLSREIAELFQEP